MAWGLHTACDATVAQCGREGIAAGLAGRPRLVLLTTILASGLAFVDGSVANVALPAIGRDLGAGAADLQWAINAYLLPLSALLLFGGAAGDRFGRTRLLIIGTALFAAGSAACAVAPGLAWLLAARGLQGLGAALLLPNSLAILSSAFSEEARGRAVGIWAASGAALGAIGPVLGGWLIDTAGWRAIFLINLPLALAAIGLALSLGRDARPEDERPPLDLAGAALATFGLGALTLGLTIGSGAAGWTGRAIAFTAAGLILMLAFVRVEARLGDRAMTPLSLFGSRSFVGLTLLTLLLYGAMGGLFVLLPYVLIEAHGYSATAAGAALLPLPVLLTVISPLVGGLAVRTGPRLPLTLGPLIVAGGFGLAARSSGTGDYWTAVLPAVLAISLGMAIAVAPLTTAVLASVDGRHTGSASGLNSAVARAGGLAATALLGSVLAARGPELGEGFSAAALAGAAAAFLAGVCAFVLVGKPPPARG